MNFNGWVAIPRSILNNTHTCKLSSTEQLVLITLTLLADHKTGSGYINAAALLTFLPELKYDTSKRVLQSLHDKGFVYRRITHASKKLYPYWIHGYQLSEGPHKMLWTNLSEVFVSKDTSYIRYEKDAPEAPLDHHLDHHPDHHPDDAPNNNTDTNNDKNKDNPFGSKRGESFSDENGEGASDSRSETHGAPGGEGKSDSDGDTKGEVVDAHDPLLRGLQYRDGSYYTASGTLVHPNVLALVLGKEQNV